MPRAVEYQKFGGTDVLQVVKVERPVAGPGQVLVQAVVASTNPVEIVIREGGFASFQPPDFPEGQGHDLAGRVAEIGPGVTGFSVGDEVIAYAPGAAQADFVLVQPNLLALKPAGTSWEAAAVIPGVGSTAWAAVHSVKPVAGETVVVSAAAGGVGVLVAQLALLEGARVIGTAGEHNFEFLESIGVIPVLHGDGLASRIRAVAPDGVDAYLDNFGSGNVAVAISLGIDPQRINTIADPPAVQQYGVRNDAAAQASSPEVWRTLAQMVADGRLVVPIHAEYELENVRAAYDELAKRHTRGKIVLRISH